MKRRTPWQNRQWQERDRYNSTVTIGAVIIAPVRLCVDDISTPSPKVVAAVANSVGLAKMILKPVVECSAVE